MKRILTIQDISCVGKCSLTVALPIISAFGIECSVLPTAILSTHTAFNNFTCHDLTNEIKKISQHWQEQNISFNTIYTGYLSSLRQIDLVSELFDKFKKSDNLILVDPVMGDNGKLYVGFDQNFANTMSNLCKKADIIVPNLTEASYLLNEQYIPDGYNENYIKETLKKLTGLGSRIAVLTGVSFEQGKLGVYGYDSLKNEYFWYFNKHLPYNFHGTGDIFASSLCGALTKGKTILDSLKISVDFTVKCIEETINNPYHNWYGVDFESAIPYLISIM